MSNRLINSSIFPLDMNVNVDIKVLNGNGEIVQNIKKHNRATSNMTEGVIRFLRGEFNPTDLNIDTIGNYSDIAHYYIPSYFGFGNIGTDNGTKLPTEVSSGYDEYAQYTDNSLYQEIFKIYDGNPGGVFQQENHRLIVQRSTKNDSLLTSTYVMTISSIIDFTSNFKFYYLSPTLDNPTGEVSYLHPCDVDAGLIEPQIIITELGLFSSDVSDSKGKLLARLVLDPDTPLIVESTSTIIINWTIGVYSIKDTLVNKDLVSDNPDNDTINSYKYTVEPTNFENAEWEYENNGIIGFTNITQNLDGTYSVTDESDQSHILAISYTDAYIITSILYDTSEVNSFLDDNGNLYSIGDNVLPFLESFIN